MRNVGFIGKVRRDLFYLNFHNTHTAHTVMRLTVLELAADLGVIKVSSSA